MMFERCHSKNMKRSIKQHTVIKKKDLQGFCLSTTHIPPASQNGRELQHARAIDRNLVNLFSEMTVYDLKCFSFQSKVQLDHPVQCRLTALQVFHDAFLDDLHYLIDRKLKFVSLLRRQNDISTSIYGHFIFLFLRRPQRSLL